MASREKGTLWINRPLIDPEDSLRCENVKDHNTQFGHPICDCILPNCPHIRKFNPDLIICTHVLYYLDNNTIAGLLESARIGAVIHLFNPNINEGSYSNPLGVEFNWIRKESKILFTVNNDKTYYHNEILNCLWNNNSVIIGNTLVKVLQRFDHGSTQHISLYMEKIDHTKPSGYYNLNSDIYSSLTPKVPEVNQIISKKGSILQSYYQLREGESTLLEVQDLNEKDNKEKKTYVFCQKISNTLKYQLWSSGIIFKDSIVQLKEKTVSTVVTRDIINKTVSTLIKDGKFDLPTAIDNAYQL